MLQNHLHATERHVYAFGMLCCIVVIALLPWASSSPPASLAQRTVTASVEQAQNFAAERLCRGVLSGDRCSAFAAHTL